MLYSAVTDQTLQVSITFSCQASFSYHIFNTVFLVALSSSKSLVFGPLVCRLFRWSFLELCKKVTFTRVPDSDSNYSSDSTGRSDSSDSHKAPVPLYSCLGKDWHAPLFRGPIPINGGSVINRSQPVHFLPLLKLGLLLYLFPAFIWCGWTS